MLKKFTVAVTTDASGDFTGYTDAGYPIFGHLDAIQYVKNNFDNTADFTITTRDSAQNLWTQSNVAASARKRPRAIAQGVDGADLTGWYERPVLMGEQIKVVVAQGGNVKSGTFEFFVEV